MAEEVGKLSIALSFDNKSLNKSVKETENTVTSGFTVMKGAMANLIAQGASAAANAITDFGKSVVQTGMQFDTAMSQVAATMGVTVDQIQDLSAVAQEMGATTKFTATEAAEGLNILAMAGLNAQDQIAGIPIVLDLASAGAMSLENAASYVVGAVNGFSDSMKNAQYYADLMAKGATLANTSVSGLGEAFSRSAATAASYGQEADSVTLSLLRLASQNVTGEAAATALNRAMADLYTPTKAAAEALDVLGVSAYEADGTARDFNYIVEDLSVALSEMSAEEANAYKATIFTTQGLNAFNKMTAISGDEVNRLANGIGNAFGSAAAQARVQIDNLEGSMTILNSSFDGAKLAVYNSLKPALLEGANGLLDFARALDAAVRGADPTEFIDGFVQNLGSALVNGLGQVGEILGKAAPVIVRALVGILPDILQGLLNGLSAMATELAAAMPQILESVISAIMRLADMISSPENIKMVTNAFIDLMLAMTKASPKITVALIKALPIIIRGIVDFLTDPANIAMLLNASVEMLMATVAAVPEILGALLGALGDIFGIIVGKFGEFFGWIGEQIGQFIGFAGEQLGQFFASLGQWFAELPGNIASWLGQVIGNVTAWIGEMVGKAAEAGSQFLAKIGEFFSQLPYNLGYFLATAVLTVGQFVGDVVQKAIELGSQFLASIGEFFSQLPGNIANFFAEAWNNVVTWVSDMGAKAIEAGSQFLQNIVNFFTQLPGKVWEFLTQTISKVVTFISDFTAKAVQAGKDFFTGIVDEVSKIPGKMIEVGKNIVEGIWNGISGAAGWLWNQIKSFCSGIVDGIKSFFGIHSPSVLFENEVGVYLAQGVGVGFSKEMDNVTTEMVHDIELPTSAIDGAEGWLSPILRNLEDYNNDGTSAAEPLSIVQNNTINNQLDIQQVSEALLEEIRRV